MDITNIKTGDSVFINITNTKIVNVSNTRLKVIVEGVTKLDSINTYDPYLVIYEPAGLDKATYESHKAKGVSIYTFKTCTGAVYVLPVTEFTALSKDEVAEFADMTVVVPLGIHPTDVDLKGLTSAITLLVQSQLGILTEPKVLITSNTIGLTPAEVKEAMDKRAYIKSNSTLSKLKDTKAKLTTANSKIGKLETFIVKQYPPC